MEPLVIISIVVFLSVAKFVVTIKAKPIIAFLCGWGASIFMAASVLFIPGGSLENWTSGELLLFLGIFPVFMGSILLAGAVARAE